VSSELLVDWPACRARGLCFELLPEVVELDDWGYPLVTGPVPDGLEASAREAVRACPTLALRLARDTRT
jgi:ferredoxin